MNLEPCTRSARQIVELLRQHCSNFGLLIVPPTFEFFIKTSYDVVRAVNSSIENTHITLNDWKHNLDNCLDGMERAWPVFESFKNSPSYQPNPPISNGRRESQVAFDLISGMQTADTPISEKTPNSISNYDTMTSFRSEAYRSHPPQLNTSRPAKVASPVPTRTASFGQASVQNLPLNLQESPQALFSSNHPISADAWSRLSQSASIGQIPPHLQHAMSVASEHEMDPAFNEFAALDAMEWLVSLCISRLRPLTIAVGLAIGTKVS